MGLLEGVVGARHSVALEERARGGRVRDHSEHCGGGGGGGASGGSCVFWGVMRRLVWENKELGFPGPRRRCCEV